MEIARQEAVSDAESDISNNTEDLEPDHLEELEEQIQQQVQQPQIGDNWEELVDNSYNAHWMELEEEIEGAHPEDLNPKVRAAQTPGDFFNLFWTDEILDLLSENTKKHMEVFENTKSKKKNKREPIKYTHD